MRKQLSIMSCALMLGLTACSNKNEPAPVPPTVATETPTAAPTEAIPETTAPVETLPPETTPIETEPMETEPIEVPEELVEPEVPVDSESGSEEMGSEIAPEDTATEEEVAPETGNDNAKAELDIEDLELPVDSKTKYTEDGTIIFTTNWVNVRSKPSLEGEIIGRVEEGVELFRYEVVNGWSKVQYERNKIGYIFNQYIDATNIQDFKLYQEVDETVYAGHDVNIRLSPAYNAPVLCKLEQGKSVRRIGIGENGWSQCIYKNRLVYINSEYLDQDPAFEIPYDWFMQYAKGPEEMNTMQPTETTPVEGDKTSTDTPNS